MWDCDVFCPGYKNVSDSDIIFKKWFKKVFFIPEIYTLKSVGNSIFFDSDEIYTKFGDFLEYNFQVHRFIYCDQAVMIHG
jgi:hypothetical protein